MRQSSPRLRATPRPTAPYRASSTPTSRWMPSWSDRVAMASAPPQPHKGRGATFNPPNRFRRDARDPVDDGWSPAVSDGGDETPPPLKPTVSVQNARTIISRNDSPDIP